MDQQKLCSNSCSLATNQEFKMDAWKSMNHIYNLYDIWIHLEVLVDVKETEQHS